jgi:hypothetical protein
MVNDDIASDSNITGLEWIAEELLTADYPDSGLREVRIRIGRPRDMGGNVYTCCVAASGLRIWSGPTDMRGVGSWHALILGIRFLRKILDYESKSGVCFYQDRELVTIAELFVDDGSFELPALTQQ